MSFVAGILLLRLAAQQAPPGGAASIYLAQCAMCHGKDGEGGRGAPLNRTRLRHAPDEEALARVIRRGIPGSEMPGTSLSPREIELVAAFVRSLGRVGAAAVKGDPAKGESIYRGKGGCTRCHSLGGDGGGISGPDLSAVGARRSAVHLRESLVNPSADVPRGFVWVSAVTGAGGKVSGARVNEDTFSIQIRDSAGKVQSYWKSGLRSLEKSLTKSPMPAYGGALSAAELDDVVAFLAARQEER